MSTGAGASSDDVDIARDLLSLYEDVRDGGAQAMRYSVLGSGLGEAGTGTGTGTGAGAGRTASAAAGPRAPFEPSELVTHQYHPYDHPGVVGHADGHVSVPAPVPAPAPAPTPARRRNHRGKANYGLIAEVCGDYIEEERKKRKSMAMAVHEAERLSNPSVSRRLRGDIIVDDIRRDLDSFSMKRQNVQVVFHELFIRAVIPLIYGEDFETNISYIMDRYAITRVRYEVLIITPRQVGKTTGTAMFLAALINRCPKISAAIFSTGNRASGNLMKTVFEFWKELNGGSEDRVAVKNNEVLQIYGEKDRGETRLLKSLPATVQVRARHACVCVCVCVFPCATLRYSYSYSYSSFFFVYGSANGSGNRTPGSLTAVGIFYGRSTNGFWSVLSSGDNLTCKRFVRNTNTDSEYRL